MYVVKYSNGLYIKDCLGFTEDLNDAAIYRSDIAARNSASIELDRAISKEIIAGCTPSIIKVKLIEDANFAKWIPVSQKPGVYAGMKCSICKAKISYKDYYSGQHNYCYKCGAKMINEED